MRMALISIIIPTYNAEKYIEKLLQSLLQQKSTGFELIILDSLSTDRTIELINSLSSGFELVRVISEKDKGIYDAMNRGVELAKGEWLYFMGCDDELFDEQVLTQTAKHLTADCDLVYGDVLWVPEEMMESGICTPAELINRNINHQRIFYRKELFVKYGSYDLQYRIAADHELNIRFICNTAVKKKYIPVTVARYHSGGFSANQLDEVFWNNWKNIFKQNFAQHLPLKIMYEKLGWYCRYLIDKHQYKKALPLFFDVLLHTWKPGFVKLTMEQFFKSRKVHAG